MVSSSWPPVVAKADGPSPTSPVPYSSPDGHGNGSFDNLSEYEAVSLSIHPPCVEIDNSTDPDVTMVKVDSANRHGCLLEVVQVLSDLDLNIVKAHVSSDGGWFVDVFHVKDQYSKKLVDATVIEYIKQSLGAKTTSNIREVKTCLGKSITVRHGYEHTALELTVNDRPGLLNEISTALAALGCNVDGAEVWTHKRRAAFVLFINDKKNGGPIEDPQLLEKVKQQLFVITSSGKGDGETKMDVRLGSTHTERRLHQLLLEDKDYKLLDKDARRRLRESDELQISVRNCAETRYSIVNVTCKDRPKLFFDTVCTLTDMHYVVFHATIDTDNGVALQEYYVRKLNGGTLSKSDQDVLRKCLEAAIERRTPEGIRLELRTSDRLGLLSDVTKKFSENGLTVTMADVSTEKDQVVNTFYVVDASGKPVDDGVVESLRREIGYNNLLVKETPAMPIPRTKSDDKSDNSIMNMIRSHSERWLWNFGFGSVSPSSSTIGSLEHTRGSPLGTSTRW